MAADGFPKLGNFTGMLENHPHQRSRTKVKRRNLVALGCTQHLINTGKNHEQYIRYIISYIVNGLYIQNLPHCLSSTIEKDHTVAEVATPLMDITSSAIR